MPPLPYTADTSPEAHDIQMGILARMTPRERFQICDRLSTEVKEMAMQAIRRLHPFFDDEEVQNRFVELQFGKELAEKLRAWKESEKHYSRIK